MKYDITGFELLDPNKLDTHPDAEMPIDEEDYQGLLDGIRDNGIVTPLLVVGKKVIDGCNRLRAAQELKLPKVPCLMVKCDDVRTVSAETLIRGRQRSTGQRIMAYLELHLDEALKQYREDRGGGAPMSRDTGAREYSQKAIAERLRVSNKDVGIALELLDALHGGKHPMTNRALSEKQKIAASEVRFNLLAGCGAIRRAWSAVAGKTATKHAARAATNYDAVLRGAVASLKNAIEHWDHVATATVAEIEPTWAEILENLPEPMRKVAVQVFGKI